MNRIRAISCCLSLLVIFQVNLVAQENVFDQSISTLVSTDINSIDDVESLRSILKKNNELQNELDKSLSALKSPDATEYETVEHDSTLDSLIADNYYEFKKAQTADELSASYLNIFLLTGIKEEFALDSEPGTLKEGREEKQSQLLDNKSKLEKQKQVLERKLAQLEREKIKEEPKTIEKNTEVVFDNRSIIRQIISASIETGTEYRINANIDNKSFEDRKAFMSNPLNTGSITKRFSSSKPFVIIEGNDASVSTVCQGQVIYSKKLGGKSYSIVVMHNDDYYTVYSNIKRPVVRRGQNVNYQQLLGYADSASSGVHQLEFEIWKGRKAIDPIHWLKKG